MEVEKILWPDGKADALTIDAPEAAGHEVSIENTMNFITVTGLTAATTLNFVVAPEINAGAIVKLKVVQGGTGRNVTMGTGVKSPNLTGVANDVDQILMIYDGVELVAMGDAWYKSTNAA